MCMLGVREKGGVAVGHKVKPAACHALPWGKGVCPVHCLGGAMGS